MKRFIALSCLTCLLLPVVPAGAAPDAGKGKGRSEAHQPTAWRTRLGPARLWRGSLARRMPVTVTFYANDECGKPPTHPHYGITRSGIPAGLGVCAADPRQFPLGSIIYLEDLSGYFLVADTGSAIGTGRIDIWTDGKNRKLLGKRIKTHARLLNSLGSN